MQQLQQVQVNWTSQNEQNYTDFTVERSTDEGKTFQVIGSVASAGSGAYGFLDKSPVTGQNWYRLQSVDILDSTQYSDIVKIGFGPQSQGITSQSIIQLYPNPATSVLNLSFGVESQHTYALTITNSLGIVVKQLSATQGTLQINVSGLIPGGYVLKIIDNSNQKLIGNAKFIKQ